MKRRTAIWILVGVGCGILCAHFAARLIFLRDKLGTISGRGHVLVLVHGRGIYQSDVDRAVRESDFANDIERKGSADVEQRFALHKLIANSAVQSRASSEKISGADLRHNIDLLHSQFPSEKIFRQSLVASGLSDWSLFQKLRNDLRARQWISRRISHDVDVSEDESRSFYDSHPQNFFVPERLHVAHLFLAAPPETEPDIVEAKRAAIEGLSVRLTSGEDFAALTAEASEDEATKFNGGDLGYVSIVRMPPDFMAAALKLRPGESSGPVRTRLGFHIIRSIDRQPPRQRSFEESRAEIAIELTNQKRAVAIRKLMVDLEGQTK